MTGQLLSAQNLLLTGALIVLAIAVFFCLLRAVIGPKFTDRLIAVNMVGTKTIIVICLCAVLIDAPYIVDVALVYALISFLAVVVLTQVYKVAWKKRKKKNEVTDIDDSAKGGKETTL